MRPRRPHQQPLNPFFWDDYLDFEAGKVNSNAIQALVQTLYDQLASTPTGKALIAALGWTDASHVKFVSDILKPDANGVLVWLGQATTDGTAVFLNRTVH